MLPRGTALVAAGLVVLGASSYVFLTLSARALGPGAFADISVLYVLVFTAGSGLFLPLEQELARAIADRTATGVGAWPLVVQLTRTSGLAMAALLVVSVATAPLSVPTLFDGSWGLLVALVAATTALWAAYTVRGVLAGLGEFGRYGWQLGLEGVSRTLGVVALVAAGVHRVGWYGVLLPVPIAISLLATGGHLKTRTGDGPRATQRDVSGALGWLLVASAASQLLVNVGPVMAKAVSSDAERAAAGQLLAGLVLARLPLFGFAAVQAALLPGLASALARGRLDEFLHGLQQLTRIAVVLGLLTTAVMVTVGQPLLRLLFGSRFHLSRLVLAELALGTAVYIVCLIVGQALVALRRYIPAAVGWVAGLAAFVVTAAIGHAVVTRVALGFLVGVVACLVALALQLRPAVAAVRSAPGALGAGAP